MDENREKEYVESVYAGINEDKDHYSRFMDITEKGVILDLGCGIGKVSNYLNKFGYECIGYDISEYEISLGKKYKPNLNLNIGNMLNIPIQNTKATGAVYAYCLLWLTDEEIIKTFKSCNKNLVDSGTIMIFTGYDSKSNFNSKINLINKEKITYLFNETGYEAVYLEYIDESVMCAIAKKVRNI